MITQQMGLLDKKDLTRIWSGLVDIRSITHSMSEGFPLSVQWANSDLHAQDNFKVFNALPKSMCFR
jgi:hypothetical protein